MVALVSTHRRVYPCTPFKSCLLPQAPQNQGRPLPNFHSSTRQTARPSILDAICPQCDQRGLRLPQPNGMPIALVCPHCGAPVTMGDF
jgi:hypothetical protein